jgi:hypothetical protein
VLPGNERIFSHTYWLFVRAPSGGIYNCQHHPTSHVWFDDQTGAVRCDAGLMSALVSDPAANCRNLCVATCHGQAQDWTPIMSYFGYNQVECRCE